MLTTNLYKSILKNKAFIAHFLLPELWLGAVVVMDNLPAHKLALIEHRIKSVGGKIINLSPYFSNFNF